MTTKKSFIILNEGKAFSSAIMYFEAYLIFYQSSILLKFRLVCNIIDGANTLAYSVELLATTKTKFYNIE
jgi:hypothetical protein